MCVHLQIFLLLNNLLLFIDIDILWQKQTFNMNIFTFFLHRIRSKSEEEEEEKKMVGFCLVYIICQLEIFNFKRNLFVVAHVQHMVVITKIEMR